MAEDTKVETVAETVTENNKKMNEIEVVKIEFLPETIDPTKEYLEGVAAEISKIEADPTKMDKDTLELVNSTKNKLVKARTSIAKACKALRDPHTAYNKEVSAYEAELIKILDPEEKRLKAIEIDAKKIAIKEERRKTLPEFLEKLATIGDEIGINTTEEIEKYNDFLLEMTPTQRDEYYNKRLGEHLESEKAIADAAKEKEDAEKAEEQKKIDEDKADIERQKESLAKEKLNGRVQKLLTLGFKDTGNSYTFEACAITKKDVEVLEDDLFDNFINDATEYVDGVKETQAAAAEAKKDLEIKEAEEKATKAAEDKAKQDAADKEDKRLADEASAKAAKAKEEKEAAEAKAETEAKAAYQEWLKKNSYNDSTDIVHEVAPGEFKMYRFVSEYKEV